MANTVNNTLNKVGDLVDRIFNEPTSTSSNSKQTCLEKIGMEARKYHLMRNEWRNDLAYSKSLADAEYLIQTEFKIDGGYDEKAMEAETNAKAQKKADKQAAKKAKKEANEKKKAEKAKIKEDRKEPKEVLAKQVMTTMQAESAIEFMRNQKLT